MHQKYIPEHASHSTKQSTIGTAYRISDSLCFADKSPGLFPITSAENHSR